MPEVLAHAGGNLLESIVLLVVFLGPVPFIFYFLVRAVLGPDEEDEDRSPAASARRRRPPGVEHVADERDANGRPRR
jgi:hypothetical protein